MDVLDGVDAAAADVLDVEDVLCVLEDVTESGESVGSVLLDSTRACSGNWTE